jgi:hypothetical protein
MRTAETGRLAAWGGLALVLAGGLALRLWGVRQGLPFVYNTDEGQHFVPHAIEMFAKGTLNPHYFANPPAFTYLLHVLFAVWYGGAAGAEHAMRLHPGSVYTLARVAVALLGAAALWLLYLVGARLFCRAVGLLAAAIEAVAFLPVFYSHLALNDVPTLAPLTLSLLGTAGILRRGRARDHVLAGVGLGLACATKYTAGIIVLPLLASVFARLLDAGEDGARRALTGLLVAGACALAAFLLANPYALLDYARFSEELSRQSSLSAEAQGKLGAPRSGGFVYYLWTLTWGLGWVPALASLGGAAAVWCSQRRLGWLLVPAPVLFLVFMGLEGRYFGRWLLPIFPFLCLLGAYFVVVLVRALSRRTSMLLAAAPAALLVAAVLAQGLIYSVHAGLVLSREDTRTIARRWMLAHVPLGANVVVEPISPDDWDSARVGSEACPGKLWCKYPSEFSRITPSGALTNTLTKLTIEDYERTLAPALIPYYERNGFCWVLSGSTQYGRAYADPAAVPLAIAYYRALARDGEVVFRASPYRAGEHPSAFNFDWSFDYYPLAYNRPGPQVTIYRLHGGGCG